MKICLGHHYRKWKVMVVAIAMLLMYPSHQVLANSYPNKAVTFIVPFAPGGPVDTAARIVTLPLNEKWKHSVVIDNKAGAGGVIGARAATKANPNGYSLFFSALHHVVLPSLRDDLGYEMGEDLVPIAGIAKFPIILIAHPSLNVKTIAELIELAKSKPNGITYGSSGTGGGTHLAGELFASKAGVKLQHVPYKGSAPAVQDLVGGHVNLMFADATSALPFIKTGQVVPLGIGNKERSVLAPDIPTMIEAGLSDYEAYSWSGLYAPKGTSIEVLEKIDSDLKEILERSEIINKMNLSGSEPMYMSKDELKQFTHDEILKWRDIIQKANIQVEK